MRSRGCMVLLCMNWLGPFKFAAVKALPMRSSCCRWSLSLLFNRSKSTCANRRKQWLVDPLDLTSSSSSWIT